MKTKTIELYTFDELPEDVQENVLDKYRHINVEDGFWYDYDGKTGFSSKELKRMRLDVKDAPDELITWKDMYFSLDQNWYVQFTDARFADDEVARKFLSVPKEIWKNTYWSFENRHYGGGSCGTTKLIWEYGNGALTDRVERILNRAVERFADKMDEVLKHLEGSYDYLISDEAVKETILINEYTFTINGKMENA